VTSTCASPGAAATCSTSTATVSWTGTLTNASFYVETAAGTDGLYLDDASFQ
jgi:hypothetical protein